jgi:hypothetical protein
VVTVQVPARFDATPPTVGLGAGLAVKPRLGGDERRLEKKYI